MDEFRRNILKINNPRKHKIRGSLGVYDAYKYIRKNKSVFNKRGKKK